MPTTIESLELEVISSSQGAESGLNTLIVTLEKLKTATSGGVGLTSVVKQIKGTSDAAKSIDSSAVSNLNGLAKAISLLSNLGGVKLSSTIATQITAIGDSAKTLNGVTFAPISELASSLTPLSTIGKINLNSVVSQLSKIPSLATQMNSADMSSFSAKIRELVTALQPLSEMPKQTVSTTLTQIKKIPDVFAGLNGVDMGAFATKIQELAKALKPLADEMNKVAKGFSAFPAKLQRLITNTNSLSTSNNKASSSYVNLYAKIKMAVTAVKRIGTQIASCITKMNDYIENVNLFTASMGEYAGKAKEYAETVGEIMGIDPGEWMRNQGVFMTLATGFGVAGDRAYTMSQQLTQLGYDLSSFFNISYEDAMQKLQSGLSGELEPLRRLGYDLSQAKLQAVALSLGISKTVSSMTQAEKAQLRYYAIMTQVTTAHGDMARTLNAPANQLRILKAQFVQAARAIGSIFIPALNAVLPWVIAVVQVVRELASIIASLFGFEMPEVDYSGLDPVMGDIAEEGEDFSESMDKATSAAKELKKTLLGIDELNIMASNDGGGGAGGGDKDKPVGIGGGQFDFDLPTYDFIGEATESRVAQIVKDIKEWLGLTGEINSWADLFNTRLGKILTVVGLVGAGLALWKLSKSFMGQLDKLSIIAGAALLIGAITCTLSDGLDVGDIIMGAIGGALIGAGIGFKSSGWSGALGGMIIGLGLGIAVVGVTAMFNEGVNLETVLTSAVGFGLAGAGIGFKLGGWGGAIGGFIVGIGVTLMISGIKAMFDDGVQTEDVVMLISGVLATASGILTVVKIFNRSAKTNVPELDTAATTIGDVSTKTSTLTSKMTSLIKNLALGIVIIAEVAVAAGLIIGAIWGLGVLLEQVAIAWQPVIDNGDIVLTAVGIGTGILVAVGVVTGLLGTAGSALIGYLALGTAMLALLGVNALLFLAEIVLVGMALEQVGIAWQPVLDNGDQITTAILVGTGLLVGIGVVAAALGVAAVASCGMLPLAIALGTAMLLELGVAAVLFIAEVWAIGIALDELAQAWQPVLDKDDTISSAIEKGTELLIDIGIVTAALGVATVASVGLLPLAIALGTALLVELGTAFTEFVDSLVTVANKLSDDLHPALQKLNTKLPELSTDMESFTGFMAFFAEQVVNYSKSSVISGFAATVDSIIKFFTKDPIKAMADDVRNQYDQAANLNKELRLANPELEVAIDLVETYYGFLEELERLTEKTNNISLASGMFTSMKEVGKNLIKGFVEGMVSENNSLSMEVKNVFGGTFTEKLAKSYGLSFGRNLGSGIVSGFKGTNFPTLEGTVSVADGGAVSLKLKAYAAGGFPDAGQMFIAREAGPEMVGTIGNKSAVVNNDQIIEGISDGVADANSEQNAILREQNYILRKLLEKDTVVNAVVGANDIIDGIQRKNRRDGKTIVPVGY